MMPVQNVYSEPETLQSVTIAGLLEEELEVALTRREILFLRKVIEKRLESARQGLSNPMTGTQKRRARYEEFRFLHRIYDHLHGIDTGFEETTDLMAHDIEEQAAALEAHAERLRAVLRQP